MNIRSFFDKNYLSVEHYWWKNSNRFSIDECNHTPYYAFILKEAKRIRNGCALDLGAGEGIDAIRLALVGFDVDAVEISPVGVEKIKHFAKEKGVSINAICADIKDYVYTKPYDIIMCNGVLHYTADKKTIIQNMKEHTKIGGINCISLFSTYSDIPTCHTIVPVYPDDEGGQIEQLYSDWEVLFKVYDRNKSELSHDEMPPHEHSFIKLICRRTQ